MTPSNDLRSLTDRRTRVLLVLDVVESVRLMEQDENGFVHRWQQLRERTRQLLQENDGRMVKSLGDGLMLEFNHVQGCVKTAFALRDFCAASNLLLPPESQVHLRIGGHLATFVSDEQDIYGTGVNMTARLSTLAGPGETVVSAELRDQLAAGLDVDIEDLGECHLKHVEKPVRAYRIGPPGHAPLILPSGNSGSHELRPTIAVIPFRSQGMEAHHGLIGEAVADELIAALSRTSEIHVISRLSTTAFGKLPHDTDALEQIRRHLGASYVLSGRCNVIGSRVNLFVELAEAKGGRIMWANNLKTTSDGLFSPEDEALSRIVSAVSSAIMKRELQRTQNHALPNLEGYTLLLSAVALMHRNTYSDFERAKELLEHLVGRHPRHPTPHAWLAQWHVLGVQQGWSKEVEKEAKLALQCTKRALDSEPDCALAVTAEGFVYTNLLHQLDIGFERYEQALAINPNDSLGWLLKGTLHAFRGEGALAMAGTEKALRLSPLDPVRYFYDSLAATAALSAEDYPRASELAQRSLKANRTHTSTLRALAIAEHFLGRPVEASKAAAELLRLEPGFTVGGFLNRSPSSLYQTGPKWAEALKSAGIPA